MIKNVLCLDDTLHDAIIKLAEGNPGALSVLSQLIKKANDPINLLLKLDGFQIRGWRIWVGYKDYCDGDISKFCETLSIENHDTSEFQDMIRIINKEATLMGEETI